MKPAFLLIALSVTLLSTPAHAQELAPEGLREKISAEIQKLAAAANAGDAEAFFARNWFWQDFKVVHSHRSTGRIGVAVVE